MPRRRGFSFRVRLTEVRCSYCGERLKRERYKYNEQSACKQPAMAAGDTRFQRDKPLKNKHGTDGTTMSRAAGAAHVELGMGATCRLSVETNNRQLPFASTKCAKSQAQRRESALPGTEMNLTLEWNELPVLPVLAATFLHTDCR